MTEHVLIKTPAFQAQTGTPRRTVGFALSLRLHPADRPLLRAGDGGRTWAGSRWAEPLQSCSASLVLLDDLLVFVGFS